uniref:CCHC-type domain-containing protein n=1 Tax=Callorhinchus milii TaxID=7868 RepID=A0A4W3JB82_CALMI
MGIGSREQVVSLSLRTVVVRAEGEIGSKENRGGMGGEWVMRERGTQYYPGQPLACLRCGQVGHYVATCTQTVYCPMGKRSDLCGKMGHLYCTCPRRSGQKQVLTRHPGN